MKKITVILIAFILLLCGCSTEATQNSKSGIASSGVWISFSEINSMLNSGNFEQEVKKAVENCERLRIENVYIHIRSYCDSLFESEYFPLLEEAENYSGDAFEFMLNAFKEQGIKVHAWINPYRVLTSSSDIEKLDNNSPAYKWLKDEDSDNDKNVCISNGIYLNPASSEVQRLIINGVREVIEKYSVDGIHFDDYFYPTTEEEFDAQSYDEYKSSTENPLELSSWRRSNVNSLLSGCYNAIKYINPNVIFSISPAASVEDNFNNLYADVAEWIEGGYIDAIIPQLYFGFEYPLSEYRFDALLKVWEEMARKNSKVSLLIGLASYKIGTDTKADSEEWNRDTDILARQARLCYESHLAEGYVFFSYNSLFSDNELNKKQFDNLKEFTEEIQEKKYG